VWHGDDSERAWPEIGKRSGTRRFNRSLSISRNTMLTGRGAHLTATLGDWKPHGDLAKSSVPAIVTLLQRHSRAFHYPLAWGSISLGVFAAAFSQRSPRGTNATGAKSEGSLRDIRSGVIRRKSRARARNPWNFMIRAEERPKEGHRSRTPACPFGLRLNSLEFTF